MSKGTDWRAITARILNGLDIAEEYRLLGVRIVDASANPDGWIACHAMGRDDANPSAGINIISGFYRDHAGEGLTLGLFDFAAQFGDFADWKVARRHYAEMAGVELPGTRRGPARCLRFLPWDESIVGSWCESKGATISQAAVRDAGGRLAESTWPRTEEGTLLVVLAFPAFVDRQPDAAPSGLVIVRADGQLFPATGNGNSGKKILTTPGSRGGLLNAGGLANLDEAEVVWKVEGLSDMLALQSVIPAELRGAHIAVTNSGGCQENPKSEWADAFAGKRVFIIHDADKPGESGARKWAKALVGSAADVRIVALPLEVTKDHGKDIRDYFAEGHTFYELLALAEQKAPLAQPAEDASGPAAGDPSQLGRSAEPETHAKTLLRLARDAELFHTPDGKTYARIRVNEHYEVHQIRSASFRRW